MKEKTQQLSVTHMGVTRLKTILGKASILLGLLLLCTFFSFTARNFLTQKNLLNIALQTSIIAIVAIGQTYTITGGGIDLSVGSVVGLSSIEVSMLLVHDVSIPIAILMAIAAGLTCGAINGFIIAYGGIAPFIATLGMLSIARGIVYVACDGVPITGLPSSFSVFGAGRIFGTIPVPIIILSVLAVVMGVIFHKSKFGRHIFALGSNENTAYLSGVNTKKVKFMMYLCCSLMAAIAGIILTSRVISGQPNSGEAYETDAIAAAVIGGASMSGGQGSIVGTLIGALMMGVLNNGLNLLGLSYFYQKIAIGMVIIAAVYIDMLRSRKK